MSGSGVVELVTGLRTAAPVKLPFLKIESSKKQSVNALIMKLSALNKTVQIYEICQVSKNHKMLILQNERALQKYIIKEMENSNLLLVLDP